MFYSGEGIAMDKTLPKKWGKLLKPQFKMQYFQELETYIQNELEAGKTIYPDMNNVFNAFKLTDLNDVKVVIFGQDPYHGEGQAHGLSFSVEKGTKIPPSLRNIYKELESDLGIPPVEHGFLEEWAKQGVLLLNTILTVEASNAASHRKRGWEEFSNRVIEILNDRERPIIFVLWGGFAKKLGKNIDRYKHIVIEGPHPSPLSVYRGFYGSKPFSLINNYLKKLGESPINWKLTE
jgi:uracil-DNA glycosylase